MTVTPVPVGSDLPINTTVVGTQRYATVTPLPNGGYIVFWSSDQVDGSGTGIVGRVFDTNGVPVGAEFRVNAFADQTQSFPSAATLADGSVVVTWSSFGQDAEGGEPASYGIYARRYSADGAPLGDEFRINTETTGGQVYSSITALEGGGFVITWQSADQDGASWGIYGQRFSAAGTAVGAEFRVNTTTANGQWYSDVAALPGGGFIVTWQSDLQDGSNFGIYAQRFDAAGAPAGGEFRINTTTSNTQINPAVAVLTGGGFVIAWQSFNQDGGTDGVYAQRYDAAGVAVGTEFRVNTETDHAQVMPSISALADGGFIVTWSSLFQDSSNFGIFGQRYDAAGAPVGVEFQINSIEPGDQLADSFYGSRATVMLADGQVVSVWAGGGALEVFGRLIDVPGQGAPTEGNDFVTGTTGNDTVDMLGGDDVYSGLAGNDSVTGGLGNDTLNGQGGNDTLLGGAGNDVLDGGVGNDSMAGGAGNDTYFADNVNDIIVELAGEGTADRLNVTFNYTLAAGSEIEDLGSASANGLILTGNDNANRIFGGLGNDTLNGSGGNDSLLGGAGNDSLLGGAGNDTLNGEAGADTMAGGANIDLYFVDNANDSVIESTAAGEGSNDRVNATVNWTLGAGQQVEELVVLTAAGLNLTGNELDNRFYGNAGGDTLTGGAGNDTVDGRGGADSMVGGTGNDIYFVNNAGDAVIEAAGEGTFDRVYTSVDFTIAAGQEIDDVLVLAGAGSLSLTGNEFTNRLYGDAGSDTLIGNAGNDYIDGRIGDDRLDGGTGIDTVFGGVGNDVFVLTPLQADRDIFPDFNFNFDRFEVSNAAFGGGLDGDANGVLDASRFVANATGTATTADQRFIYDTTQRLLIYDSNGNSAGGTSVIGVLNASTLTAANFNVV